MATGPKFALASRRGSPLPPSGRGRLGPAGAQAQDERSSAGACSGTDDTLSTRHCIRSSAG
jgi:hypothetical protein